MTKVDASRKTSFRKMVDGVSPKIQHGIQDSHIQVQRSSCKLSKTQFKKGGPCLLWGVYTSTCHSWLGKATDSGDAGTPSSKSSRFTVAPGIPKNLPGMEKEFQIGGLPSDPILHCITNRLGVHYQLYLTITI